MQIEPMHFLALVADCKSMAVAISSPFAQMPEVGRAQPPQLRKLRCALIFYFEILWKLHCGLKSQKCVAL